MSMFVVPISNVGHVQSFNVLTDGLFIVIDVAREFVSAAFIMDLANFVHHAKL